MSNKFLDNTGVSDLVNSIATNIANKYATKSNTLTTKSVVIDPDTTTEVGIYQWFYPTTITTNPIAYGTLIVSAIDGYYIQIAIYANEPFIFIRNKVYDTSWTDWKRIGFHTSNQNLIINSDFKINQRGNTSVVSSYNGLYCVDRWRVNGTCTQTSSGVTVSSSGSGYGYGTYSQTMENIPSGTLSLSTKCYGKIFNLTCIDASEAASAELHITDSNGTDVGYLHTVNSGDKYSIEFIINSGCEIQIEWVKLEFGSVATPFVPPDPTIELLKCKRYFEIKTQGVYGLSPNDVWISGFMFDSPKRVIPSIKLTSSLGTQNTLSTYTGADSNITLTGMPNVRIDRIEGSPCNQNIGTSLYSYTCIADAEIY